MAPQPTDISTVDDWKQWAEYVRKDLQVCRDPHGGGKPKTRQAGGLPESVCCNAPDLRIGRSVLDERLSGC